MICRLCLCQDLDGAGSGGGGVRVRRRGAVHLPEPAGPQLPYLGAGAGCRTQPLLRRHPGQLDKYDSAEKTTILLVMIKQRKCTVGDIDIDVFTW